MASFVSSRITDWRYVSLVPQGTSGERLRSLRIVSLACLLLCLLAGSAAAYLFARRNYDPVARLVRLVGGAGAQPNALEPLNEYRFLQDTMGTVLNQNEDFRRRLQLQNVALKKSFLSRLLTGSAFQDGEYVDSALATFGIRFESESFMVLLFYISGLLDRDTARIAQPRLLIEQIVAELAAGNVIAEVTEVDEMIGCLVNAKAGRAAAVRPEALRLATAVRAAVRDRLGIVMRVSASAVHQTVAGAPAAYREALGVMEYKVAMEDDATFSCDEIPMSANDYDYSMTAEQHLMNHVKAGDSSAATAVIDEVFESRFVRTSMSIDLIKCLVFDVVGTILKTLPEISPLPDARFVQDLHVFSRLAGCVTVQEMKQEIKDMLETVCAQVRQHRTSRADQLETSIVALVRERLGDWNLSVSSVADHLGLSAAYLTKVFRDQTGKGLGEYIGEARMEAAKQLLGNQDLDIKDVAARVGYIHSSVFIRAFKKHEGVTPGQFREAAKASVPRDG